MNKHLCSNTANFTSGRRQVAIHAGLRLVVLIAVLAPSFLAQAQPIYGVDSKASRVDILTDSAGMFSKLGHRHVVSARNISGRVELDETSPSARIEFAVADMVVDDPAARRLAGDGFDSQPSDKDIAGTRRNLLGEKLLEAQRFPSIRLDVSASSATTGAATFDVIIYLRDATIHQNIPGTLVVDDERVVASADFSIEHEALGLKPFSALGGTIRVAPLLEFRVHIEASSNPDAR